MIKKRRKFPSGYSLKMKIGIAAMLLFTAVFTEVSFAETNSSERTSSQDFKFSLGTTWHSFMNFEQEETNLQMYELHLGYKITDKDTIGIKIATWKLFVPLGIQMWDPHFLKESEYYPGRLLEYGVGVTYQRTLWKGLFAALEVLPLKQKYLNEDGDKITEGFRLYTSYHVGYHIPLFNNRVYIAPQIHCNYWPIMTDGSEGFKEKESKEWSKNYFLFEPNLYIGVYF